MIFKQSNIDRFFKYTQENKNGCLEWIASISKSRGYGFFWFNGKNVTSHRFAWMIKYGAIPNDLNVCHSCDNRKCVNWKHLWLGTHQHNAQDRNLKGRQRKRMFTSQEEESIALDFYTSDTTQKELAVKFKTTRETIAKTIRQKHFKDKYGHKKITRCLKITSEMRNEIILRRSQGETMTGLAKSFNVTLGAIQWNLDLYKQRARYNHLQRIRRLRKKLNPLS